ncbi:MAG: hypothetical protein QG603_775, partial [Patescibacteria group bacterium]|nr:hypothetical protein [Patescibacteria group bacterium]
SQLEWRKNYILLALAIFVLVQLVASILGVNWQNSLFGNYERMEGLLHYVYLLFYFILLINSFKFTKDWVWVFRFSIFSALWVILYELFGRWGWIGSSAIPASAGTTGNTIFFGFYLMFNVFLALIAHYIDRKKQWRIFYLVFASLAVLMIFVNASRSSMLGLLFGAFIFMLIWGAKASKKIKFSFAGAVILILMFASLVYVQKSSPWVQNTLFLKRLTDISTSDFSTNNRLLIWQVGAKAFVEKPILGYGPENAIYGLNKYYNPEISEQWFDRVHNFILEYLLTSGIFGLLSFLSIFVVAYILAIRYLKQHYFLGSILIASLSAYLLGSLFAFDSLVTWLPLILLLAFINYLSTQGKEGKNIILPNFLHKNHKTIVVLAFILLVAGNYLLIFIPTKANSLGLQAAANTLNNPQTSLNYYQKALSYDSFGKSDILIAMVDGTKSVIAKEDVEKELKKTYVETIEKEILSVLQNDQHNIRTRMSLADVYLDYSAYDPQYIKRAIDLLEPSIADSPKRLEIYSILARAYIDSNNMEKALGYLEHSLSLYDGREQDHINLTYFYFLNRDDAKFDEYATKYINKFQNTSVENYNRLISYYMNLGMPKDLLDRGIIQRAIEQNPDNTSFKLAMVEAYVGAGLKIEALDYINNIAKTDPAVASELTKYLKVIE